MPNPRIIFAGTPEFAARHLQALIDADIIPIAVYTQPDRRAGRGKKLMPSAVKSVAERYEIPVIQPQNFKLEQDCFDLAALQPDLMIVVAYGLILPEVILSTPRFGCVNVHASLLPRWRGAAPIQRAIEKGDKSSGVSLMQMEKGLDTGPVIDCADIEIGNMNAAQLHDQLAQMGASLLIKNIQRCLDSDIKTCPQSNEDATYAQKLLKKEGQIDWTLEAKILERRIRAFNPYPVCFTYLSEQSLRIWCSSTRDLNSLPDNNHPPGTIMEITSDGIEVQTGKGRLIVEQIQLPGKKALNIADLLRGHPNKFVKGMQFL